MKFYPSLIFTILVISSSAFSRVPHYYYRKFLPSRPAFHSYAHRPGLCKYTRNVPVWGSPVCGIAPSSVAGCQYTPTLLGTFYRCSGAIVDHTICAFPLIRYQTQYKTAPCGSYR